MPSSPDESFGGAVTRRIWTDVDNLLLVFVGSAAEFALVGENHWLFYTMALPSAPWDRFLSTLAYNRKIFLTPKDKVPALAQAIRGIHTRVEEKRSGDEGRATAISNGAFKAVGAMLIDYGIAGYAYLHRRPLSDAECEAHYQDERAFFALMGITDLEADYPTYRQNRETVLRDNLHVNAHTRDDQIETVLLRLLRGAGPRGLAGMLATDASNLAPSGSPVRPLLTVPRTAVVAYADAQRVPFIEDPSNATLTFQRNRIRHEILPACERADPGFGDWCWVLGTRAAAWREEVESMVTALGVRVIDATMVIVPVDAVARLDATGWEVLWPAIAARAGVVMDRRGVVRASRWAPAAQVGQEIPLSGGARLARTRTTFVVHGARQGTVLGSQDYIP
jgi:hypothetical protein